MNLCKHSQFRLRLVLGIGVVVATVLCIQCVRTYLYTDAVLVPQQAEREAERQGGVLSAAARSAGITDPRSLGPVIQHVLASSTDRVLWVRVLDLENHVLAQAGNSQVGAIVPLQWWNLVEKHESLGKSIDTPEGRAFVALLPFRLLRPPNPSGTGVGRPELLVRPSGAHHPGAYIIEIAIPLNAVAGAFEELRQNLIVGVIASIALLLSVAVIGLRTPQYLRGRYLESELQLARRVQSDLQPKLHAVSPNVQFGASAVAADHVGGDFYDIFETESGKIAIVLGDVSGKGVAAALLGSVLQGAIRSSTASHHERACERINRMLCERTACERFATLFWGVFDPATSTLRYVNAGHAAPMLIRNSKQGIERLDEGGPVLGLLPVAAYSARTIGIESSDMLVLYSDGINEATNENDEEFGEDRIKELISGPEGATPAKVCERIMNQVAEFASAGVPPDDRTLLVVDFQHCKGAISLTEFEHGRIGAVA